MKRILSLIILLLAFFVGAMAKGDKIPQYDITGAGSGTEGTILVKVYVYSKSVKDEDLKRAAVARALITNPRLLLADEPTGAVDSKTTNELLQLFRDLNEQLGLTIVIVTHDRLVSSFVNRAVMIRDGRTSSEFIRRHISLSGLADLDDGGAEEAPAPEVEELAVVDRSGRVQLPREYLDALGVSGKDKLKTHLEDGRIILTPAWMSTEPPAEQTGADEAAVPAAEAAPAAEPAPPSED